MAAPTEIYVDPAINANSGSGTIGDPYGDLQYALNTVTRDATNGNRFNVKAGTAEVLAAALSLTTYGTPTAAAPLIFQGYTASAGDGGKGSISGNGSVSIYASNTGFISWVDLRLGNCGASQIVVSNGQSLLFLQCELYSSTNTYALQLYNALGLQIRRCWIHDCGDSSSDATLYVGASPAVICDCLFTSCTGRGMYIVDGGSHQIARNRIVVPDAAGNHGIWLHRVATISQVTHNSVLGSGRGIGIANYDTSYGGGCVANNLVDGFSGVDGTGIYRQSASKRDMILAANAVYNCTTAYNVSEYRHDIGNETLSASPFAKTGSLPTDFTSSTFWPDVDAYFAPVNTGAVHGGAWLTGLDKGAVQHTVTAYTYGDNDPTKVTTDALAPGTLDLSLYTLISGVVSADWVVTGHDNYTGGAGGNYPTTATSQAAQLATDQVTVGLSSEYFPSNVTILGVAGTGPTNAEIAEAVWTYAGGRSLTE